MVKIGDEGQAMRDKRWNRLERGEMGTAPFFASLLEGRACRRNGGREL